MIRDFKMEYWILKIISEIVTLHIALNLVESLQSPQIALFGGGLPFRALDHFY